MMESEHTWIFRVPVPMVDGAVCMLLHILHGIHRSTARARARKNKHELTAKKKMRNECDPRVLRKDESPDEVAIPCSLPVQRWKFLQNLVLPNHDVERPGFDYAVHIHVNE